MPKVSHRSTRDKARRSKPSSSVYRVGNGSAYDQSLKQRGSVTVWFSPDAVTGMGLSGPSPSRGAISLFGPGD